jgi:hemerythrin-like domain-containing protein
MTGVDNLSGASVKVFDNFHRGLVVVHGELRDALRHIATAAATAEPPSQTAAVDVEVARFCQELLNHHKSEDAFLFPAFRSAGRLRSSDVAFLDARDAEHVEIHRLCLELEAAAVAHQRGAVAVEAWRRTITGTAQDLARVSAPHFAAEEETLTATYVATLITSAELEDVYKDMGRNWNNR